MRIVGTQLLDIFCKKHADARSWVANWLAEVKEPKWSSTAEVKSRYASASFLPNNVVIFNVRGNEYRLEVQISYEVSLIQVRWVGTHAEYNKRHK